MCLFNVPYSHCEHLEFVTRNEKFQNPGWGRGGEISTIFIILHLFDSILFFKFNVVKFFFLNGSPRSKIPGEKKLPI